MKKIRLLILLSVCLVFTACTKNKEKPENGFPDNNLEANEEGSSETDPTFDHVYPLTGVGTDEAIDHRVVGVMVNNHPAARPQSGLSQADIVFEILAEGNTTRFLALFQSEQPDVVGPVRSAREYYFELAKGYDGLYVYHGSADVVQNIIDNRAIEYLNGSIYDNDGHLFKRESFRKAPHNSYLQYGAVYDVAESKGYDILLETDALPFVEEDTEINGEQAEHITIMYPGRNEETGIEYVYNEQTQSYDRFENQEQTVELNTNEPIQSENVFIVETYHEVIDKQGRRAIDLDSGGNAYLIQKGMIQKLEWKNENGKIIPVKDGQVVGFMPGQTWINIVPSDPGLEQSVKIWND